MEAELERLDVVKWQTQSGGRLYMLTAPAKNDVRYLPKAFENDPWGFWLDGEKTRSEEDSAHRIHTYQVAKDEHDNYDTVKKHRKILFIVAVVELLAIIALGILQLQSKS